MIYSHLFQDFFSKKAFFQPFRNFHRRVLDTSEALPHYSQIKKFFFRIFFLVCSACLYPILGCAALVSLFFQKIYTLFLTRFLRIFIDQHLRAGKSLKDIEGELLSKGWKEHEIDVAFSKLMAGDISSPSPTTSEEILPGQIELTDACLFSYPYQRDPHDLESFFHSIHAILYLTKHKNEVIDRFNDKDDEYLTQMQQEIIDNGLKLYQDMGGSKERIQEILSEEFQYKNIYYDAPCQVKSKSIDLDTQIQILFQSPTRNHHNHAIITSSGISIAIIALNEHAGFLFNAHNSSFHIVSRRGSKTYIAHELCFGKDNLPIHFYHART